MNKKRTLITVFACILVCAISITGTLAYLSATSEKDVTNTFLAEADGKLLEDTEAQEHDFSIVETPVKDDGNGNWIADTEGTLDENGGNTYKVVPGSKLLKDAKIHIVGKTTIASYLYLEVVDTLPNGLFTYGIDSNWTKLTGVTGKNGGEIYVYKDVIEAATEGSENLESYDIQILAGSTDDDTYKGGLVTVSSTASDTDLAVLKDADKQLSFYSYMAQASAGQDGATLADKQVAAFNACFGSNS